VNLLKSKVKLIAKLASSIWFTNPCKQKIATPHRRLILGAFNVNNQMSVKLEVFVKVRKTFSRFNSQGHQNLSLIYGDKVMD
jgi:hypothetical protein